MNAPTGSHELIMVMGVQRSGTNVLFSSLATDRTLSAFPEDIDSAFYCNFLLRPLSELAALIEPAQGRKHVGVVAQRNIDAGTSDTLAALDAARTFSPRRALLLKRRIVTYLRESLTTHPTASEAGRA